LKLYRVKCSVAGIPGPFGSMTDGDRTVSLVKKRGFGRAVDETPTGEKPVAR
jgi:hypothetical protein